jgi:hypothetical protein
MEEIKVKIAKDGGIQLECNGFSGSACNITKVAEEALGLVSHTDKGEAYMNELNLTQTEVN